ncbi:CmcJ/NvfI family oxidoreductase [Bradyrhizobium sp. DASA03120]|uniref:CmcJ/NvfI family oxidoreductase n=1 Tax=Bradyrhizobium sp. SMVTL-02 TaxID=3395917 RepID=UPI003F72BC8A
METTPTTLYYSAPLAPGGREDNWECDAATQPPTVLCNFRLSVEVNVGVLDLRTADDQPTLDGWGFEKHLFPTRVDQRGLIDHVSPTIEEYQHEIVGALRRLLNADDVVLFDTVVRHKDTEEPVKMIDSPFVGPYMRVHVDQNPRSAWARLGHHGGPNRVFRRFQILNAWRPLLEPVRNYPLALCDYRSLDPEVDLVTTRRVLPEWMHERWVQDREGYSLKHRPEHRWCHWSALTPDETIVFKCYDSASSSLALKADGAIPPELEGELIEVAGLCPHSAFLDPYGPTKGHLRSSIEVRALVFYA